MSEKKYESDATRVIQAAIDGLPPAHREQCLELIWHIEHCVEVAGEVVGPIALAMAGARLEARFGANDDV